MWMIWLGGMNSNTIKKYSFLLLLVFILFKKRSTKIILYLTDSVWRREMKYLQINDILLWVYVLISHLIISLYANWAHCVYILISIFHVNVSLMKNWRKLCIMNDFYSIILLIWDFYKLLTMLQLLGTCSLTTAVVHSDVFPFSFKKI